MNRFLFESDTPKSGPLLNVHRGLKMDVTGGVVRLVQGNYAYHHYASAGNVNKINLVTESRADDGWNPGRIDYVAIRCGRPSIRGALAMTTLRLLKVFKGTPRN